MESATFVFVVAVHVTLNIFGMADVKARLLPDGIGAFASKDACRASIPAVDRKFSPYRSLVSEYRIACEKLEIKK